MKKLSTLVKLIFTAFWPGIPSSEKQSARYELVRAFASIFGIHVYNHLLWWHQDAEYLSMWEQFPESNDKIHERRFNLFNISKLVSEVDGDTAECGVFKGSGSHIILSVTQNRSNQHHIFDSFEGLSAPDSEDVPVNAKLPKWAKGDLSAGEQLVMNNLRKFEDRVRCYKGWIPSRFDEVSDRSFSLVHIDVDLYQPTKDALEFFYPRMNRGGMIICDDYGSKTCPGATKALDDFFKEKIESVVHLTTGTGFVIKN